MILFAYLAVGFAIWVVLGVVVATLLSFVARENFSKPARRGLFLGLAVSLSVGFFSLSLLAPSIEFLLLPLVPVAKAPVWIALGTCAPTYLTAVAQKILGSESAFVDGVFGLVVGQLVAILLFAPIFLGLYPKLLAFWNITTHFTP